jgi:membrane protease YdiL (CAAX protease family)
MSRDTLRNVGPTSRLAGLALGLYLAWVAATYLLEGRPALLQRPDPLARADYTVVANVLIGTLLAGWVLRNLVGRGDLTLDEVGFRSPRRTLLAIAAGAALGSGIFLANGPRSLEPLVVLNVFAQVLPTTIAEVMVCWAVLGNTAAIVTARKDRVLAVGVGLVVSSVLFGAYHFAHSSPFNQVPVVLFLTWVGVVTSLVYFIGRDVYATAIAHNALGMTGIMNTAPIEALRQPLYPLYALALLAVLALVGTHVLLTRAGDDRPFQRRVNPVGRGLPTRVGAA